MSMDLPPEIPDPSVHPVQHRRSRTLGLALFGCSVLVLVLLALILSRPEDTRMAWLTPAELAQATHAGPLTRLKYQLRSLAAPLIRKIYGGNRNKRNQQILFATQILKISPAVASGINLGAPASTNAEGMRAWIVSPTELAAFQKSLNSNPGVGFETAPRIQTVDGMQAQASIGSTILTSGSYVPVGITINLIPKVVRDSVKLLIGATDTEIPASSTNGPPSAIKTNFAVACRVIVPNAGAVVIDGGGNGKSNYWLTVSPVFIDVTGKPIRH